MAGTPESFGQLDLLLDQSVQQVKPTLTYGYNWELGRIIGMVDGKDASFQAVRKILSTNKYSTPIYDWRYGHELQSLIGKPKPYAKAEIERIIKEAVFEDDRTVEVVDLVFLEEGVDFVTISVTIRTITMQFIIDLEVPW